MSIRNHLRPLILYNLSKEPGLGCTPLVSLALFLAETETHCHTGTSRPLTESPWSHKSACAPWEWSEPGQCVLSIVMALQLSSAHYSSVGDGWSASAPAPALPPLAAALSCSILTIVVSLSLSLSTSHFLALSPSLAFSPSLFLSLSLAFPFFLSLLLSTYLTIFPSLFVKYFLSQLINYLPVCYSK